MKVLPIATSASANAAEVIATASPARVQGRLAARVRAAAEREAGLASAVRARPIWWLVGAGVAAVVVAAGAYGLGQHQAQTAAAAALVAEPSAGVTNASSLGQRGSAAGAEASAQAPAAAAITCAQCGVVESVQTVQHKGEGSGLGAVAGGVVGGALGNQVGAGSGRTAMTVLGAIGGGLAGNEVEKRARSTTAYRVTVRLDNGEQRTVEQATAPLMGQRVKVDGRRLRPV